MGSGLRNLLSPKEIFWLEFRTSRIFISSPSSLHNTAVILASKKHNYFAISYNFNTQIGANFEDNFILTTSFCDYLNQFVR